MKTWILRSAASFAALGATMVPARAMAQGGDMWTQAPSSEPETEYDVSLREAPRAPDPPARPFGTRGQWSVDSAGSTGIFSTHYKTSGASMTSFSFSPSVSYFVAQNFSIGFVLGAYHSDDSGFLADGSLVETKTTTFAAGPQFGFNIPLGGWASIYPRLAVGLESIQQNTARVAPGPGASADGTPIVESPLPPAVGSRIEPWVNLFVPVLIHPVPHFFLGLGPTFHRTFGEPAGGIETGVGERASIGFGGLLGGSWGGPSVKAPPEAEATPGLRPRRFGDKGDFSVMGGVNIGGQWTSYDGTGSSASSVSVTPAFDYFVENHVSLGIELDITSSTARQVAPTTPSGSTSDSTKSLGAAVRLGVEVPIADAVSLFLVANLGFGHASYVRDDGVGNADSYGEGYTYFGIAAPVLVHIAQHLFVGVGPSFSQDLSRTVDSNQYSNPATTFGASFVVGGWL